MKLTMPSSLLPANSLLGLVLFLCEHVVHVPQGLEAYCMDEKTSLSRNVMWSELGLGIRGARIALRHAGLYLLLLVVPEVTTASPLLGAKALRCQTSAGTSTSWDVGRPNSKPNESVLTYSVQDIDTPSGQATIVGRGGSAQVTVVRTASTLSFLEQIRNGGVFLTTVYVSTLAGPGPGRFAAVESRHNPLIGDPVSSQLHGWCEVIR